jgi:hypothetical protein
MLTFLDLGEFFFLLTTRTLSKGLATVPFRVDLKLLTLAEQTIASFEGLLRPVVYCTYCSY